MTPFQQTSGTCNQVEDAEIIADLAAQQFTDEINLQKFTEQENIGMRWHLESCRREALDEEVALSQCSTLQGLTLSY